jgi:hypothetical protein
MAAGRNRHTWSREAAAIAGARGREAQALRRKNQPRIAASLEPLPRQPNFGEVLLAHTRARVTELFNHLALLTASTKVDFSQVDRLASAIERLAELERRLDGRPLPGSRRPPAADASPRPLLSDAEPVPLPPAPQTPRQLEDIDDLTYSEAP